MCQDFEVECYVQTTMDTESGQDATKTEQATVFDEETQTEEFHYLFQRPNRYSTPDIDFSDADDKIRFYTGLPTKEILITAFQHVAPHAPRRFTTVLH